MKVVYIHNDRTVEKVFPVAVKETWSVWHTGEQRTLLWEKLDEMRLAGKTDFTENGTFSTYDENGAPTKYFSDRDAANEYVDFINQWKPDNTEILDV